MNGWASNQNAYSVVSTKIAAGKELHIVPFVVQKGSRNDDYQDFQE